MAAKPNEIQITRVYDAPVKLVWEMWTDLKHIEKWWGPRGFTLTTKSKELRPGGRWIYTMHGPDGTDYPNIATYHEVVKYEKLVYDHGATEEREKLFTVTVTFKEMNGKTLMTMTSAFPSPEVAQASKKFIRQAHGNSTWDRLGEYLERERSGKDTFIIAHAFETDVKSLFDMWVKPELFAKWLGPAGCTMTISEMNAKEGGRSIWSITLADGRIEYGQMDYQQVIPNKLIVYTQHFCDQDGNPTKHPFVPNYPDKMLTTVTFAEEGPKLSRASVRWEIAGESTDIERKTFSESKTLMMIGWEEAFDKLESLL